MVASHGWVWARVADAATLERWRVEDELKDDAIYYRPAERPFARLHRYRKSDELPRWVDSDAIQANMARYYGGEELVAYYYIDGEYELYTHWVNGQKARTLRWVTGEWSTVFGDPEPWEDAHFFDHALIPQVIQDADPRHRDAVARAYDERRIVEGAPAPPPLDMERAILKHYGFVDAWDR